MLLHQSGDQNKPRILVLAPTSAGAVKINGTTIQSGLIKTCKDKSLSSND